MSCNIGIKNAVSKYVSDKPYLRFNGSNFIQVTSSPQERVNPTNYFSVATSVSNTLNKAINSDITLGKIFYPIDRQGIVGVEIAPTEKQLSLLNAQEEEEIQEALQELEKETPLKDRLDIENETTFGVNEEGDSEILEQLPGELVSSTASPKTISLIKDFLKRIGVNIESGKEIVVNGKKLDANAIANITQSLIHVIDGKEATSLTEEAMHFAVEIIEQTNPPLFNKLLSEINSYNILKQVFADYSTDPNYQIDGVPNVRKLKKEAIGKILAEVIINKTEGTTEKPELLAKTESWWEQIKNWLRNWFIKKGFDKLALDIILEKDIGTIENIPKKPTVVDEIFLQQSKQEQVYNKIKEIASVIEKKTVDGEEGYYIDGRKIKRRVSDIVKDWYSRRFADKDLTKDEYQNSVDDLKAEKGTKGHKDLEYAFSLFVDENGNLRETPLSDEGYVSQLDPSNRAMYELLRDNLQQRLNSFPRGTKFLSEAIIYDAKRDIAGTVDFLAITPDGKMNILDWKFMDLNTDRYKDVPWYKVNAWHTQMEQYKYIISSVYGIKNQDFQQTRMIPIKAVYLKGNREKNILPKLKEIKIGDVNIKNIQEDYLIPVGLEGESTGNEEIDKLLSKLNAIYKKFSEEKVVPSEKLNKAEQLNALFSAIRQLQMRQNIEPLIKQALTLNKQIQDIINKYNTKFKGQNPKSFSTQEIEEFTKALETSTEALQTYTSLDIELGFLFEGTLSPEDKKIEEDLKNAVKEARKFEAELKKVDLEFINNIIAGSEGVENLSSPEKIVRGITKFFGTSATIQLKSLETLFKKANKAFAFAGMDSLSESKKLIQLKNSYQKWAYSKGLSIKNQFNIIKKANKNELIDEFNPEFYSLLRKKIEDQDFKWIRENVDKEKYKEEIKLLKEEEYRRIDDKPRVGTEEQNKADVAREKTQANSLYDVSTQTSVGWLLYDKVNKFPDRNKWESKEWKTLNLPENSPALDFYNYIRKRNDYYTSIGYIHAKQSRIFLPWIRKGFTEKLIFGGKVSIGEQFLRNISMDESDVGYGKIDPLTGKPIDIIPKYFTSEIEDEVSTDLFKTMSLYNDMAIKFSYLSQIEAQGRALVRMEKNKKAIATSIFGKTEYKDGVLQLNPDNSENSRIIEDMVKAIVYQQKYIESEAFDQILGKLGSFGKTLNEKLGFHLLPENLEGRQVSVNKIITQLNNNFQIMALGLNPLSSMSNFFGGTVQSLINSGVYFTKQDFVATEMWLLGNKMAGKEDKKKLIAALDYFIPFTDHYNTDVTNTLSIGKLNDQSLQDFLMIMMRTGDKAVQTVNFFAYLRNSIVIDGEVMNARQYLKTLPEYLDFYKGTSEQRKQREQKYEEDVKSLVEEKGILKLGTIVKDEFVIPGVERKSQSVVELRRKVQQLTNDALGNRSEETKRLINLTVYGNSFMVFKNWIPRLIDVRTGNLKYNSGSDAYEWGRTRMIFRIISEDFLKAISNLSNSLKGNDKGMTYVRQLYEKKKNDYENDTNKTLNLTESQFIDLVRQNIKNQLFDVLLYAGIFSIVLGLKALPPDDDEDEIVKNQYKFLLKATDKFKDELGYFYDPTSLIGLVSTGIFPSVGLIKNYRNALSHFLKENYGLITQNDKLVEENDVIKYWMKTFPITNQTASMLPIFYPNLAKDLGIRMQSQYGFTK